MGVYTSESLSNLTKEQWIRMKEIHEKDLIKVKSENFYPTQQEDIKEIVENITKLDTFIKYR